MKNSISLIGMAGAGKSTVGRANILNFRLIDSDLLIEEPEKFAKKILDDEGYIKLREIENSVLKNLHFREIINWWKCCL